MTPLVVLLYVHDVELFQRLRRESLVVSDGSESTKMNFVSLSTALAVNATKSEYLSFKR